MNETRQRPGDIDMPEFDVYGDAFFDVSVLTFVRLVMSENQRKDNLKVAKFAMKQNWQNIPNLVVHLNPWC
jgi:hypothetical protein